MYTKAQVITAVVVLRRILTQHFGHLTHVIFLGEYENTGELSAHKAVVTSSSFESLAFLGTTAERKPLHTEQPCYSESWSLLFAVL